MVGKSYKLITINNFIQDTFKIQVNSGLQEYLLWEIYNNNTSDTDHYKLSAELEPRNSSANQIL